MSNCPKCGKKLPKDTLTVYCTNCGYPRFTPPPYCPYCKSTMSKKVKYCPDCGKLTRAARPSDKITGMRFIY